MNASIAAVSVIGGLMLEFGLARLIVGLVAAAFALFLLVLIAFVDRWTGGRG